MARTFEATDPTLGLGDTTTDAAAAGFTRAPSAVGTFGFLGSATTAVVAVLLVLAGGGASLAEPWRADSNNTQGWQFMTPEERIAHQAKIRSFKDAASCRAYQLQHHARMEDRARRQGSALGGVHRDFCAHLELHKPSP